ISRPPGSARARLVRAAARRAALGPHRHVDAARARERRELRDHPRRPAPVLAPAARAGALRMKLIERAFSERDRRTLLESGMHPILARVYAARRIRSAAELEYQAARLIPPSRMKGIEQAARLLADAIGAGTRMLIIADYDADGATACALGIRALRAMAG